MGDDDEDALDVLVERWKRRRWLCHRARLSLALSYHQR